MNYFEGIQDQQSAKTRYRELCKKHHPDLGGDPKVMKIINSQYDSFKKHGRAENQTNQHANYQGFKRQSNPFWGNAFFDEGEGQSNPFGSAADQFAENLRKAQRKAEEDFQRMRHEQEEFVKAQVRDRENRKNKFKEGCYAKVHEFMKIMEGQPLENYKIVLRQTYHDWYYEKEKSKWNID